MQLQHEVNKLNDQILYVGGSLLHNIDLVISFFMLKYCNIMNCAVLLTWRVLVCCSVSRSTCAYAHM